MILQLLKKSGVRGAAFFQGANKNASVSLSLSRCLSFSLLFSLSLLWVHTHLSWNYLFLWRCHTRERTVSIFMRRMRRRSGATKAAGISAEWEARLRFSVLSCPGFIRPNIPGCSELPVSPVLVGNRHANPPPEASLVFCLLAPLRETPALAEPSLLLACFSTWTCKVRHICTPVRGR